jgi:hypothetical protein
MRIEDRGMKKISKLAFFLLFTAAGAMVSGMTAGASEDIRIIGESEEEYYESGKSEEEYHESEESENPEEGTDEAAADSVKRKEACAAGRALYLKMQDTMLLKNLIFHLSHNNFAIVEMMK